MKGGSSCARDCGERRTPTGFDRDGSGRSTDARRTRVKPRFCPRRSGSRPHWRTPRVASRPEGDPLEAYVGAALALDERSDVAAARAWVGIFAEALSDPELFAKVRRMLDAEVLHVERRSQGSLSTSDASAVVAFVVGALVFGAFAPRKTAGFAEPSLRKMLMGLRGEGAGR
jgi:hypothetical protein